MAIGVFGARRMSAAFAGLSVPLRVPRAPLSLLRGDRVFSGSISSGFVAWAFRRQKEWRHPFSSACGLLGLSQSAMALLVRGRSRISSSSAIASCSSSTVMLVLVAKGRVVLSVKVAWLAVLVVRRTTAFIVARRQLLSPRSSLLWGIAWRAIVE